MSGSMELKQTKNPTGQSDDEFSSPDMVQALANQVQLCEQRILELAPTHPIPVLQEHLGQPTP